MSAKKMMKKGQNKSPARRRRPTSVRSSRPAHPDHVFHCGDSAVLTITKKGRRFRALVTVKFTPVTSIYTAEVCSKNGGSMVVNTADLRPGGVLDLLTAALED